MTSTLKYEKKPCIFKFLHETRCWPAVLHYSIESAQYGRNVNKLARPVSLVTADGPRRSHCLSKFYSRLFQKGFPRKLLVPLRWGSVHSVIGRIAKTCRSWLVQCHIFQYSLIFSFKLVRVLLLPFSKKSVKLFVNSLPFSTQWKMWGFCVGTGVSRFPALTLYAEYILTYRWIGGFFLASLFLRTIYWIEVIWLHLENPENEVRVKKQSFPISYFSRNLSWLFFEFQLFQSLFSWNCFIWRLPHGLCRTTADSNSQRYRRNRHVPCITSDTFLTGFLNDFSLHLP